MNSKLPARVILPFALVLAAGAVLILASCAAPSSGYVAASSGPTYYDDDYIYYPEYEVYYGRTHHTYVYRDGPRWVRRPEPPRQWAPHFPSAPSVHVDFRDSPERHHNDVVRNYPRTWKPKPPPAPPLPPPPGHRDDNGRRDDNNRRDDKR